MIAAGNFFFKYRNYIFIFLYLAVLIPSSPLFPPSVFGKNYYWYPLITGLLITLSGQLLRGATIGLAYITRGGNAGKVYAEELVTTGIFRHCRNPLYAGNLLMLTGLGILSNSLLYMIVFIPFFLFVYQSIVLAEEHFLRNKFGPAYEKYCRNSNRWLPDFRGIAATFNGMHFNWKRWLLKEYNTLYVWLSGITLLLFLKYHKPAGYDRLPGSLLVVILVILLMTYFSVRYLKKSGKMKA